MRTKMPIKFSKEQAKRQRILVKQVRSGMTYQEVGDRLGISTERVRQLYRMTDKVNDDFLPMDKYFWKIIKDLKNELGLSDDKIAKEVDTTSHTVGMILNGSPRYIGRKYKRHRTGHPVRLRILKFLGKRTNEHIQNLNQIMNAIDVYLLRIEKE